MTDLPGVLSSLQQVRLFGI